ncbi:MAG: VOC family protein [Pseudomonadota bacterium]
MPIDHVNVRCTDLDTTRAFLEEVAGLTVGDRPPFSFPGYWLYDADGQAVIHLIGAKSDLGDAGAVDHVAFRFDDFRDRTDRLAAAGHTFTVRQVPGTQISQTFIDGPDGLTIELQGPA